jgi:AraC-like DNA-binding protein
VELVIHIEEPIQRVSPEGVSGLGAVLVGQATGPIALRLPRRFSTVGASFRPAGARPFANGPLSELTGRSIPLADAWGREGTELHERLRLAPGHDTRVAILRDALERRLGEHAAPRRRVCPVARVAGNRMPIRQAAAAAGVSVRTLERGFLSEVGLPPRELRAILRFRGALARLSRAREVGFALFAVECGYADQAHLVREFRRFTGTSPAAFAAVPHPFSDRVATSRDGT